MKKKLEADLISIAHRILQLKNKSDINQLYFETQKLYEKLTVLRFVEENFGDVKPTIGLAAMTDQVVEVFKKLDTPIENEIVAIDNENTSIVEPTEVLVPEPEVNQEVPEEVTPLEEATLILEEPELAAEEQVVEVAPEETNTDAEEEIIEEIQESVVLTDLEIEAEQPVLEAEFKPAFELSEEIETVEETPKKVNQEPIQISFQDLLGGDYHDTLFVKKQAVENTPAIEHLEIEEEVVAKPVTTPEPVAETTNEIPAVKAVSLNDKLAKGINIDLNDRLAFIKHLFGNSSEDYNRVLSQLNSFNSFYETRDFVQEMVKPDYNNWVGKQDYEDRFMDIIEKKFL
ncbi:MULTISPECIES: hypothetical protein [unclassified Flavobacterium]|uniref:hypothetical protein n=1 Tax=unclassified Flavobacterium TaxID=196869 RepID=UPI00131A8437|nr:MULTISPECIES: hypothetical protein [unclassified Flavobacterium]